MAGRVDNAGNIVTKAEMVAQVANDLIAELIERSRRSEGLRDYYDIAVVGYSGAGVTTPFGSHKPYLSTIQLNELNPEERTIERQIRLPNGEIRFIRETQRCWIKPEAVGLTPMYEGLFMVYDIAKRWCAQQENLNSFPPMIFNITDGESTDCDYADIMEISSRIKSIATNDGKALLVNVHIASNCAKSSMLFPSPREIAQMGEVAPAALSLFNAASELPSIFMDAVCDIKGTEFRNNYKAMSFNCSISELVTILNIGSISIKRT
ncbi:MAG: VWA domain-containing protein [Rikenellaceae bacterium]